MARINEEFASKFLKALDIKKDTVVTIDAVNFETFKDDGREAKKVVLEFKGSDKKMVVNKTNRDILVELFGDETDDWEGARITLYVEKVMFEGKRVPSIRIRDKMPASAKKSAPVAAAAAPEPEGDDEADEDDDVPF
jgi:hypothetical protein